MQSLIKAALLFLVEVPLGAASHRLRIHPNPSITILSIAQGRDGFLWLAAADGLYRFDGFHYRKVPEYPFRSARFIGLTEDGALWIAGREGLVRYQDRFQIVLKEAIGNFAALSDHLFVSRESGVYGVDLSGNATSVLSLQKQELNWLVDPQQRVWYKCASRAVWACWVERAPPYARGDTQVVLPFAEGQAFRDAKGRVWAADDYRAAYAGPVVGRPVLTRKFSQAVSRPGPLVPGRDGQLWFIGEVVHGLNPEVKFRDRKLREQYLPTAGFEDDRRRMWVATKGEGLVEWSADPEWERWFPEDFGDESTAQVVRAAQGEIVAATQNNLYRLDARTRAWRPIARDERRYASVLPLANGEFLASIREQGLARISASGEIVERLNSPMGNPDDSRLILQTRDAGIWVANRTSLLHLEGQPGSYRVIAQPLPMVRPEKERGRPIVRPPPRTPPPGMEQAIDLEVDRDGRLWVGFADGLAWRDEKNQWRRLNTDQPVRDVRAFTLSGDRRGSDIWVALRGAGYFLRLQQNSEQWKVTTFSPDAGYGPRDSHFIKRDSRGWIWRGSSDGVHISDGEHVAPNDWIHIGLRNGLATDGTDQYGFFEDVDGSVWISGEHGISHLRPDPAWFEDPKDTPAPRITWLEAGSAVYWNPGALPKQLPADLAEIRLDVGSLQAPPFRDAPFRYRLRPMDPDWRMSTDGTLVFHSLPNGEYALEVGFAGNGSSEIFTYAFQLGPGASGIPWIWILPAPIVGALWALLARRSLWSDKVAYRVSKGWFVVRRHLSGRGASSSPNLLTPPRNLTGETFVGRFQLIKPVARSGFSTVYDAVDLVDSNARVAIKVLNATTGDGWVRDRFAQEVMALQSVRHRGIVRILDSWIGPGGEPCLAMPFLEGPTLRVALNAGPFSPSRVAHLTALLGSALAAIHSHGVVHRDLKPENVILSPGEDLPVLIDFGAAGLRGAEAELAATTLLAGSFYYMAPERLSGQYSPATDVYAFGIIVLEMLTGRRLAELNVMFADAGFLDAIVRTVQPAVGLRSARPIAEALAATYDPMPQHRPAAEEWAKGIASLLEPLAP